MYVFIRLKEGVIMRKIVHKKQTGLSLDIDLYDALAANKHLNRSAWINDIVRTAMEERGMLV